MKRFYCKLCKRVVRAHSRPAGSSTVDKPIAGVFHVGICKQHTMQEKRSLADLEDAIRGYKRARALMASSGVVRTELPAKEFIPGTIK